MRFNRERPTDIRVVNPRHPYAHHIRMLPEGLQALAKELRVPPGGRVLDYGCADLPYKHFFTADVDYVAADLPGNPECTLTLRSDGTVPLPDHSVDAVLSTQVLEHVVDPGLYLSECFRLLRPGGRLLLSTHGIFVYHPDPVDLWRWTGAGLQRAVEGAGFEVVRFEGIIGLAATGLQLFQDAISYRIPDRLIPYLALVGQKLIAFVDRRGSPDSRRSNAQVFALVAVRP